MVVNQRCDFLAYNLALKPDIGLIEGYTRDYVELASKIKCGEILVKGEIYFAHVWYMIFMSLRNTSRLLKARALVIDVCAVRMRAKHSSEYCSTKHLAGDALRNMATDFIVH